MANPIKSVDGKTIRCPSTYQWDLQDVSASDAGRTENGLMDKKRIRQCVKLQLAWQNISTEDASKILKAFNPQYINVSYLDPMSGGYQTKQFYVGDRTAPMYNATLKLWSNVTFNIVER